MARAIWKGVLRLGALRVPVKLYSAVQDRTVHFRLFHARDRTPVRQRMVNPKTGEEVPHDRIRKGYELKPRTIVVLEEQELAELEPEPSRDVDVSRFVDDGAIHDQLYERPYWLGPDGATEAYFALAEALAKTAKAGVAHWVMRDRAYVGALRAEGEHLALVTLRHAEEVVTAADLEPPRGPALDRKELALAEQLVSALESDFDPGRHRDEYRERLLHFIEQKAKGRRIRLRSVERKPAPRALESALRASLRRVRTEGRRG